MTFKHDPPLIGIVGACASGKTTLIRELSARGYQCRHIAQEHSYVPDMWRRITNPDILIYLEVSYETTLVRKNLNWTQAEYQIQVERLSNARKNADLIVDTNSYTAIEMVEFVSNKIDLLLSNVSHKKLN